MNDSALTVVAEDRMVTQGYDDLFPDGYRSWVSSGSPPMGASQTSIWNSETTKWLRLREGSVPYVDNRTESSGVGRLPSREGLIGLPDGLTKKAELHTSPPVWLREAIDTIWNLLTLDENWDSYGAPKINPVAVMLSCLFLGKIVNEFTPMPSVVPAVDGGVQFEWHEAGHDIEIEISPDGKVHFYYERHNTNSEIEMDVDVFSELPIIQRIIRKLSDPIDSSYLPRTA